MIKSAREKAKNEKKCQHKKFVTANDSINISINVNFLKMWSDDFQITSIICIFIAIGIHTLLLNLIFY